MIALLILILFTPAFLYLSWNDLLKPLAQFFHEECVALSPPSAWGEFYLAIVCAEPLPASSLKEALRASSLLHLVVVSGTHLIFLEQALSLAAKRWTVLRYLVIPILFAFTLGSFLSPPAVRALINRILINTSERYKLFWRPYQISWFCMILLLVMTPQWWNSYSMLLSSAASFVVMTSGQLRLKSWQQHTLIYVFLFPLLLPLGSPSPLSIFYNLLIAPVVGLILFPLSLICFFIPPLTLITDQAWLSLSWILQKLTSYHSNQAVQIDLPMVFLWSYVCFFHLLFIIGHPHFKRRGWL